MSISPTAPEAYADSLSQANTAIAKIAYALGKDCYVNWGHVGTLNAVVQALTEAADQCEALTSAEGGPVMCALGKIAGLHPALPFGKERCDQGATSEIWDAAGDRWLPICQDSADVFGPQGATLRTLGGVR